jgi:hypothetical protein
VLTPQWSEFVERNVSDFELESPRSEVAAVLRRYRTDLDAAARASAEGRAAGLAALADQAVLAVEMLARLQSAPASSTPVDDALRRVAGRMLEQVHRAGLEIVRLDGANLAEVAELAQIDAWQYDARFTDAEVIEEIEPAVLHEGRLLHRGRVVVGAPIDRGPEHAPPPPESPGAPVAPRPVTADRDPATVLVCPVLECGTVNSLDADVCAGCLTELTAYRRLSHFPDVLFNRGLRTARAGQSLLARDCFAAVVLWDADDLAAHNAYALSCLESGDPRAAARVWREVLARSPDDAFALRGLASVRAQTPPAQSS